LSAAPKGTLGGKSSTQLWPNHWGKLELPLLQRIYRHFRPELIGRFDEKFVFKPLSPETQREIAMIVIGEEVERYRMMGIDLAVDEETLELLIRKGITKALGARPMKRTVQKYLGDIVRERVMSG
jgi:ATP-dependent Clp protease ATP-binding subunit ClpC